MKTALTVFFVAAAACGGSKQDSTKPEVSQEARAHEGEGHKGEHGNAGMPQIAKFHDTLAPRWHAAKSPQRMADTCSAMAQFRTDADAIVATPPPRADDAATWTTRSQALSESVAALETTCKANDAVAFEPAFERVHHSFHAVMEAAGGHHEEHSKGEHDKH
jgi:hypothetical protein